jgi:tetratricopeptide (TPR) repeat protein
MKTCPTCKTESKGAFCPSCGTSLGGARCRGCSAPLASGARFCTACGQAAAGGHAAAGAPAALPGAGSQLPWYIAGGAAVALVVMVGFYAVRSPAPVPAPMSFSQDAASFASQGQGPLTGTPREQADRLFNRIMQAVSAGDTEQAAFFLPMGLMAYRALEALDLDGLYHLAVLETAAGEYTEALATTGRMLSTSPNHLLALAVAADASRETGDAAAARRYYEQFLQVYEAEARRPLPEYQDHAQMLPEYRTDALAYLAR